MGKYDVGTIHKTNKGYDILVIKKLKLRRVIIRFLDLFGCEKEVGTDEIFAGTVSNPYHKLENSIGYLGEGLYKSKVNGIQPKSYIVWKHMCNRSENSTNYNPTYKNVTVCEEWHNYQNFAKWYEYNLIEDYELDKDLLQQNVENKIYSPETCIFLPKKVNGFLTNKQNSNTSGYIGVSWHKLTKKWSSTISIFGLNRSLHLGLFDNIEEASIAYQKARAEQAEKVKSYMRSLGHYSEEIIQLIK